MPIAAFGLLLITLGAVASDRRALVLGVCHVSICVLFVVLVNLLSWGPGDAHVPFALMGACYTTAALGSAGWFGAFRTLSRVP